MNKNTNRNIELVTAAQFRCAASESNQVSHLAPVKFSANEIETHEQTDNDERIRTFVISTGAVDRDNDTIDPTGWELGDFAKSGVVLWAHDRHALPIAKPLATWVEDGKLKSRAQFTTREANPFGAMVFDLIREGVLKSTSVGFSPLHWRYNEERGEYAIDFLRQSLLEWSVVPVPSNPEALLDAKSKGVDLGPLIPWAEKALDGDTKLVVPKSMVEDMYKAAKAEKLVVEVGVSEDTDSGVTPPDALDEPASGTPDGAPAKGDLSGLEKRIETLEAGMAEALGSLKEIGDKLVKASPDEQDASLPAPLAPPEAVQADTKDECPEEIEIDIEIDAREPAAASEAGEDLEDEDVFRSALRDAMREVVSEATSKEIRKRKGRLD